eukprot:scaffold55946_cov65-Phaeocystis_antarctica.AAC.2
MLVLGRAVLAFNCGACHESALTLAALATMGNCQASGCASAGQGLPAVVFGAAAKGEDTCVIAWLDAYGYTQGGVDARCAEREGATLLMAAALGGQAVTPTLTSHSHYHSSKSPRAHPNLTITPATPYQDSPTSNSWRATPCRAILVGLPYVLAGINSELWQAAMVRMLLERGASVNLQVIGLGLAGSGSGYPAGRRARPLTLTLTLTPTLPSTYLQNTSDYTALTYAAVYGHTAIVQALLDA